MRTPLKIEDDSMKRKTFTFLKSFEHKILFLSDLKYQLKEKFSLPPDAHEATSVIIYKMTSTADINVQEYTMGKE